MKKRLFCFLLAAMLIVGVMPMAALADGTVSVKDVSGTEGTAISVPITVTSPTPGFAFQASISIPDSGLTLTGIAISAATQADDVGIDDEVEGGAFYTINGKNITFVADTGAEYTVTLNFTADKAGVYDVGMTISEMRDYDEKQVISSPVSASGKVTVEAKVTPTHIPGDINGDSQVNNKDVTRLKRYMKYKDVEVVEAALDVNGDGAVNNKDVTRLKRYLKYKDVEVF